MPTGRNFMKSKQLGFENLSKYTKLIGDKWTVSILRNIQAGVSRFVQLELHLQIAPSVLYERLNRLVDARVISACKRDRAGRVTSYEISKRGLELLEIVSLLESWCEKHSEEDQIHRTSKKLMDIGACLTAHHVNRSQQCQSI